MRCWEIEKKNIFTCFLTFISLWVSFQDLHGFHWSHHIKEDFFFLEKSNYTQNFCYPFVWWSVPLDEKKIMQWINTILGSKYVKNWPNPKKIWFWPIFDFFGISDFPGEQIWGSLSKKNLFHHYFTL